MAIVKYSSSFDELRGKLGNSVFQRCGQSLSIRSLSNVKQLQSADMLNTKVEFAELCAFWRTMSFAQKQTFSDNAPSYPTLDSFGNPIVLNAFQLFMYKNRVRQLFSAYPINNCVPYSITPYFNIINQAINLSPVQFKFTLFDNLPYPRYILIYLSEPLNSPNDRQMPNMKFFGLIGSQNAGTVDFSSTFISFFKTVPYAGQFIYILARTFDDITNCFVDVPIGCKYVNP
jgi:hypothetical protein